MPFDLFVARADALRTITATEFHRVMESAPARPCDRDAYRVRHQDHSPWFVCSWRPDGTIVLSTSYTNHRFLRNFADMFDVDLRIAVKLDARLVEEVGGTEVTDHDVDALLAVDGEYVELQAQTFGHAREQLEQGRAPLEFPVGPIDLVSDYFVFHVAGGVATLPRALGATPAAPDAWYLLDEQAQQPVAKILHRPDGRWQLWPSWSGAHFADVSTAVLRAVDAVRAPSSTLTFLGEPCDAALLDEIRGHTQGLGVDFYLWLQGRKG